MLCVNSIYLHLMEQVSMDLHKFKTTEQSQALLILGIVQPTKLWEKWRILFWVVYIKDMMFQATKVIQIYIVIMQVWIISLFQVGTFMAMLVRTDISTDLNFHHQMMKIPI